MSGKLPMIFFTDRGWTIERAQRVEEFLREWDTWLDEGRPIEEIDMTYLKDRNRPMIMQFSERVRATGHPKYIPLLNRWAQIAYKKVQAAIQETVSHLRKSKPASPEWGKSIIGRFWKRWSRRLWNLNA